MSWRTTRAAGQTAQTSRQVAVIDLGSNSWRLVVFSYAPGRWWKRTDELYETVRIGAGLGASGRLSDDAIARGLETLGVFARFCRANGLEPDDIHVVATSAIRDAANGETFLADAQQATGLTIETLSAEDEAYFGYVAAINTTTLSDGVVLDIGGGSMQLTEVHGRRPGASASFPLGAVRMTEQFLAAPGPARKKDLARLRAFVRETLSGLDWLSSSGNRLVGIGGAVRNLAAAAEAHLDQPIDLGIQGFVITPDVLRSLVGELAALPRDERGELPGIKPGRGDIILAAAVVIETVLELGGFDGIEATEAGLREGVFLARTLLAGHEPLFENVREAAVRNLAIQYESDIEHVEHVARLSLQMFDSLVARRPVRAARRRARAAVGRVDAARRRHDDLLRRPPQALPLPDRERRAARLRPARAGADRPDQPLPPQGGAEARRDRAADAPGDEELLDRCSVILRLSEHLERGRDQSVSEARLRANGHGVDLHLEAAGDLTLPRWSVERYGDGEAFERVFHRRLLIG